MDKDKQKPPEISKDEFIEFAINRGDAKLLVIFMDRDNIKGQERNNLIGSFYRVRAEETEDEEVAKDYIRMANKFEEFGDKTPTALEALKFL